MSLEDGLVSAYEFNNTITDAHDGLNYTGPIAGYAAGKIGQALATDGLPGTTPHRAALITTGSFSAEAWVYVEADGSGAVWSQIGAAGVFALPGRQSIYSINFSVGVLRFAVAGVSLGTYIAGSMVGRWTHLIATYDDLTTTAKLFVDGVLRLTATAAADYTQSDVMAAGGMYNGAGTDSPMSAGRIDMNRVWSRQLTDGGVSVGQEAGGEIAELWNGGAGLAYPFSPVVLPPVGQVRAGVEYDTDDLPDPGDVLLGVVYG